MRKNVTYILLKKNNMKNTILAILLLVTAAATKVSAQTEAEMKAWMDYMTPGDVHKMLAASDGEWNGAVTLWMAPGTEPSVSKSTAKNEMIMGGRYQLSKHSGETMGMPFEGMSLVGYDNAKKVFISTWIDNMGTGVMTLEGTWDAATKTITFKGKCVDPMSGKDINIRETFQFTDANTQKMEMFMVADGKESKTMSIIYTRKM